MSDSGVQIYQNRRLVKSCGHLTDYVLADHGDYEMFVEGDGLAERITVGAEDSLTVQSGGRVSQISLLPDSIMDLHGTGRCDVAEIQGFVRLGYGAQLNGGSVCNGGGLMAFTGSTVSGLSVLNGGYLHGSLDSVLLGLVAENGAKLDVSDCRLEGAVLSAGAEYDLSRCVLVDCTIDGDFGALPGKELSVEGSLTLTGRCFGLETLDFSNAVLNFSLVDRSPVDAAFMDALPEAVGYGASVAVKQSSGIYGLAEDGRSFSGTLTFSTDGAEPFTAVLGIGETAASENTRYGLVLDDDNALSLTVSNRQVLRLSYGTISTECDGGWWSADTPAVSVYARQAIATVETRDWCAGDFSAAQVQTVKLTDAPSRIAAEDDGVTDLFLAEANGVWTSSHLAQNAFTGAQASLRGRNRFSDIFIGSADHAVLMLTDGSDALFADDIHSALGDSRENRLQDIAEIHAGAGDDLVDLTCINVAPESAGCLLDGGDGDDILWGGTQADLIIGGKGDDTLVSHRDGVRFFFGDNWGHDTVQVGDGLDYTLCFNEGTQLSIAYDDFGARLSCGDNSVAVMGVFEGIEERISCGGVLAS